MNQASETMSGIEKIAELYQPDQTRIKRSMARQADLFSGRKPDAWPLCSNAKLTPGQEKSLPNPGFKSACDSAESMLAQQLRGALSAANSETDSIPSIRANFGTSVLLSCFGLEQEFQENAMPWLHTHLSKAQIAKLTPDDIKIQGSFAKGLEFMRAMKDALGDRLPVYCMDAQGPFDLAHLLMGDDIFMELYDDPPFVHHLLELCLALGIKAHELMKRINGEPRNAHFHSNAVYAENIGLRICEDTTTLISPEAIAEFAMPYTRRLAQRFGGAWVHYCGRNDHLTKALCEIPEVRAINFGIVPGKELDQPFETVMEQVKSCGKIYIGSWRKRPEEDARAYLKRLHAWSVQGCLLPWCDQIDGDAPGLFKSEREALDFWRGL